MLTLMGICPGPPVVLTVYCFVCIGVTAPGRWQNNPGSTDGSVYTMSQLKRANYGKLQLRQAQSNYFNQSCSLVLVALKRAGLVLADVH